MLASDSIMVSLLILLLKFSSESVLLVEKRFELGNNGKIKKQGREEIQ